MKIIKKIIFYIFVIAFFYIIIDSGIKNLIMLVDSNSFMKGMELDESLSTNNQKFYTKKGLVGEAPFTKTGSLVVPGSEFDIIISMESALDLPLLYPITSFLIGGHACISALRYNDKMLTITKSDCIETAYNEDMKETEIQSKEYWNYRDYYVLRVKCSEEQALIAYNEALTYLEDPYNLLFVLNTKNNHYCSDLVSKAFKKAGINLNQDGGITTMLDLYTSSYTNLIMIRKQVNDTINYYYLSN